MALRCWLEWLVSLDYTVRLIREGKFFPQASLTTIACGAFYFYFLFFQNKSWIFVSNRKYCSTSFTWMVTKCLIAESTNSNVIYIYNWFVRDFVLWTKGSSLSCHKSLTYACFDSNRWQLIQSHINTFSSLDTQYHSLDNKIFRLCFSILSFSDITNRSRSQYVRQLWNQRNFHFITLLDSELVYKSIGECIATSKNVMKLIFTYSNIYLLAVYNPCKHKMTAR